jgi:hypothetical protein
MHHHHAVALLVFSIVFAAFALFTLCTFAPKAHASSVVNNSPGNAQISALAGLPIRRRSTNNEEDSIYVRDGILLNYRGQQDSATMSNNLETIGASPLSPVLLLNTEDNKSKVYQECAQHLRIFDPSLPLETTFASQGQQDGVLSKLFTAATLFTRDNEILPKACIEHYQHVSPSTVNVPQEGVYFKDMPAKREIDQEQDKKTSINGIRENVIFTKEGSEPRKGIKDNTIFTEGEAGKVANKIDVDPSKVKVDHHLTGQRYDPSGKAALPKSHLSHHDYTRLDKRVALDHDLLGAAALSNIQKKKVVIDFKKAQRDAQLADLAEGFLIETEYPTPGRKVVQHLRSKPSGTRTVKLHFEGEKLVLDDPATANAVPSLPTDAQGIMDSVLGMHDQQQVDSYFNYYPQPGSRTMTEDLSAYKQPSHRRYDLVKRDSKERSPVRRSFRFDRRV